VGFAFAGVLLALLSPPAWAAQTIGSDFSGGPLKNSDCAPPTPAGSDCTESFDATPTLGDATASGVVTSWAVREFNGTGSPQSVTLRILRPVGGSTYRAIRSGEPSMLPVGTATTSFPTRVPISAGDRIGFDHPITIHNCGGVPGTQARWNPQLADGEERATTAGIPGGGCESQVQATVEPDADGDVFGDETQDACPGLFGSVTGCPRADLQLTSSASQGPESYEVTYALTIKNNGPDPVPDASLSSSLPPGATFQLISGFPGGLASGASETLTYLVHYKLGTQTSTATVASLQLGYAATRASGAGDPNPANDTVAGTVIVVAPAVSRASASPKTFRLGSLLPKFSRRPPVGTTIRFSLSEPARVKLAFSQLKPGRRVGRRCLAPTRSNRRKPRCTRRIAAGSLTHNGHAGTNKVRFQGRLSRFRKLKPGRYTLTITATDPAGNRSNTKATSFTIIRG